MSTILALLFDSQTAVKALPSKKKIFKALRKPRNLFKGGIPYKTCLIQFEWKLNIKILKINFAAQFESVKNTHCVYYVAYTKVLIKTTKRLNLRKNLKLN